MVQEHHAISMGTYHGGAEERISLSGLSTTTQSIVTDNKEIADMVAKIKVLERDNQSEQTKYAGHHSPSTAHHPLPTTHHSPGTRSCSHSSWR